jgi:hypothetical protein
MGVAAEVVTAPATLYPAQVPEGSVVTHMQRGVARGPQNGAHGMITASYSSRLLPRMASILPGRPASRRFLEIVATLTLVAAPLSGCGNERTTRERQQDSAAARAARAEWLRTWAPQLDGRIYAVDANDDIWMIENGDRRPVTWRRDSGDPSQRFGLKLQAAMDGDAYAAGFDGLWLLRDTVAFPVSFPSDDRPRLISGVTPLVDGGVLVRELVGALWRVRDTIATRVQFRGSPSDTTEPVILDVVASPMGGAFVGGMSIWFVNDTVAWPVRLPSESMAVAAEFVVSSAGVYLVPLTGPTLRLEGDSSVAVTRAAVSLPADSRNADFDHRRTTIALLMALQQAQEKAAEASPGADDR